MSPSESQFYQDLVETSQDLIWQCDAAGRYTFLNGAWEEVLGYPIAEMLGHPFTEFQPPEAAERDTAVFRTLLAGKMIKGFETIHLKLIETSQKNQKLESLGVLA